MTHLRCLTKFLRQDPILEELAIMIAEKLREDEVCVVKGVYTDYEVRFPCNRSWFKLDHIIDYGDNTLSFDIELMVNDEGVWNEQYREVAFNRVSDIVQVYGNSGFPDGKQGFIWSSTRRAAVDIDIGTDDVNDGLDDFDFGDSGQETENATSPLSDQDESQLSDEEESPEDDTRFGNKSLRVQDSIVPRGIQKLRVVSLRYNGDVIAFRFKTDKGAFDMRKQIAAQYGLGGFKTETFIALQNVNGMLMSSSERKRKVCVPDVSDCPEDCQRLMDALFDSGGV